MNKAGMLLAASLLYFAAAPSSGQTVGTCARGGGANQPQPVWVLFDLDSAHLRPVEKPRIAEAVRTAKDRQVSSLCVVGHTDKLGDKALNTRLARERAQAVAAELVRAGYPANHVVIAADPEAFGNMSLGSSNASEKDRRGAILFSRWKKLRRDLDHGLADDLAIDQHVKGVGRPLHRKAMRDMRAHDAELRQPRQLDGVVAREIGSLAAHRLAGPHAQDGEPLDQHVVRHDPARPAGGETHHQQPRAIGRRAHGLLQHLAANRVVDHVGPAAVRHALHDGHEVGCAVVDDQVGPLFAHGREPPIVAAGRDHLRAEMPAELHRGHADAPRRAMDQQGLARLEPGAMDQRVVGRRRGDAEA